MLSVQSLLYLAQRADAAHDHQPAEMNRRYERIRPASPFGESASLPSSEADGPYGQFRSYPISGHSRFDSRGPPSERDSRHTSASSSMEGLSPLQQGYSQGKGPSFAQQHPREKSHSSATPHQQRQWPGARNRKTESQKYEQSYDDSHTQGAIPLRPMPSIVRKPQNKYVAPDPMVMPPSPNNAKPTRQDSAAIRAAQEESDRAWALAGEPVRSGAAWNPNFRTHLRDGRRRLKRKVVGDSNGNWLDFGSCLPCC